MKTEEAKDGKKLLGKPYFRGDRVEYRSVSSMDFPPGLDCGGRGGVGLLRIAVNSER